MPRTSQRDRLLPLACFSLRPRLLAVLERGGDRSGKAMLVARKVTLAAETLAKGGAAEPEPERDSGGDRSADDGAEPLKVRDSPCVAQPMRTGC